MRTCETCIHWGEHGLCMFITDRDNEVPPHAHSKRATAQDSEQYGAWFTTTADFGCVEHESGDA